MDNYDVVALLDDVQQHDVDDPFVLIGHVQVPDDVVAMIFSCFGSVEDARSMACVSTRFAKSNYILVLFLICSFSIR